jgi:signal peptidase I
MAAEPKLSENSKPLDVEKPSFLKQLWRSQSENIQVLAIALVLAILIRLFVAEPRYIPSDSMVPTLFTGDRLVVEKVSYWFHPPQRGDIVVFNPPIRLQELGFDKNEALIKRVIGQPGQTIQIQTGQVLLDNQLLEENYTAEAPAYEMMPLQIPEGSFFVMGDNRNNSNDSHVWGPLPQQQIIGRAIFRFWPPDRMGLIEP